MVKAISDHLAPEREKHSVEELMTFRKQLEKDELVETCVIEQEDMGYIEEDFEDDDIALEWVKAQQHIARKDGALEAAIKAATKHASAATKPVM